MSALETALALRRQDPPLVSLPGSILSTPAGPTLPDSVLPLPSFTPSTSTTGTPTDEPTSTSPSASGPASSPPASSSPPPSVPTTPIPTTSSSVSLPAPPSSPTMNPSPSSPSITPLPTPALLFKDIPILTACTPFSIGWDYSGPEDPMSLYVYDPNPVSAPLSDNHNQTVAVGVDPTSHAFNWTVNVPTGVYQFEAWIDTLSVTSDKFNVLNGSDPACLQSASSPSSALPSATSGAAGSGAVDTSSSHSNHTGAIVGGVIGGVAFLVAVAAATFYFGLCSGLARSRRRGAGAGSGPARELGKWDGLSSKDSGIGGGVVTRPRSRSLNKANTGRDPTDSIGNIVSPTSSTLDHASASYEDLSTLTPEKVAAGPGFGGRLDYIPSLAHRASARSSVSSAYGVSRSPSVGRANSSQSQSQNRALTLAKLDGASEPASPFSAQSRRNSSRRSVDGSAFRSPLSGSFDTPGHGAFPPVSGEMIPMNRSSSSAARRATRKPAPAYVPENTTINRSNSSVANTVPGSAETYAGDESASGSSTNVHSHSHSHGHGHGLKGSVSKEDLEAAGVELPHLTHKSSFGPGDNRPVHYLIPDMPPPVRQ